MHYIALLYTHRTDHDPLVDLLDPTLAVTGFCQTFTACTSVLLHTGYMAHILQVLGIEIDKLYAHVQQCSSERVKKHKKKNENENDTSERKNREGTRAGSK